MNPGQRPIFQRSSYAMDTGPRGPVLPSEPGQTSGRATGTRQITRNRASYSCHACRRRKIKCDKIHPICTNCSKTGDECTYDSTTLSKTEPNVSREDTAEERQPSIKRRRANSKPSDGSTPSSNGWGPENNSEESAEPDTIESRLDRLTSMVEKLSRSQDPQGDKTNGDAPNGNGLRLEKRNPQDATRDSRRLSASQTGTWGATANITYDRQGRSRSQQRSPGRSQERGSDEFPIPTGGSEDLVDPLGTVNLGYLSLQDGGRSRYVGSTYWAYISDELGQLNQLLKNQTRYFSATTAPNEECRRHDDEGGCFSSSGDESSEHNSFHRQGGNGPKRTEYEPIEGDLAITLGKSILFRAENAPRPSRYRTISTNMLKHVPTKQQSHVLFRCFLSGVHAVAPIIYPPAVLHFYNDFWEWYEHREETAKPCPNPAFIPLLYAIWYGGSVSISLYGIKAVFGQESRASISARLHDEVTRCLTLISFPRNASIPALAAFLIVQTVLAREEEPLTSSMFVGLALRVALSMGLHRDPEPFGVEPAAAETRRRIWYHIVHMDSAVALASGLPAQVCDEQFWDVHEMSELKDMLIGTPEAKAYEEAVAKGTRPRDNPDEAGSLNRTSMVNVHYVTARGKYVMSDLVRKLLKIQLGTKPLIKKDMEEMKTALNQAEGKLNAIIKRIPTRGIPEMGFTPDSDSNGKPLLGYDPLTASPPTEQELQSFVGLSPREGLNEKTVRYHRNTLIAFHKWARILLSLLIDKAYCVSYAPFLKNGRSKLWPLARQCALRHCHGFMRKFISLATDPAFQPFHWSWPGTHQPMHATMILLIDLYERPDSREASRSRAFIDKMFSLAGPDGGIVSGEDGVSVQRPLREGGREAWDMLRGLREKAWQKAGLDPDILWTEEDQIKVGAAKPPDEMERHLRAIREDSIYTPKAAPQSGPGPAVPDPSNPTAVETISQMLKEEREALGLASSDKSAIKEPAQQGAVVEDVPEKAPPQLSPSAPQSSVPQTTAAPAYIPPIFIAPPVPSTSNGISPSYTSSVTPVTSVTNPVSTFPTANTYFNPPTTASYSYQPSENSFTASNDPTPRPGTAALPEISSTQTPSSQQGSQPEPEHHFDWEQWDAVFGQYVPLDDFMDLDENSHWSLGDEQEGYDDIE